MRSQKQTTEAKKFQSGAELKCEVVLNSLSGLSCQPESRCRLFFEKYF